MNLGGLEFVCFVKAESTSAISHLLGLGADKKLIMMLVRNNKGHLILSFFAYNPYEQTDEAIKLRNFDFWGV